MKKLASFLIAAGSIMAVLPVHAQGRDTINIVGSSTVYPFTTVVAERFGKSTGMKTPKVESTGTGGGMKLFCDGAGIDTPDFTNASRRIKSSEYSQCTGNGVEEIIEIKVGYDGLTLAQAKGQPLLKLTREQVYLALAKKVPHENYSNETLVDNPHKLWSDIDKSLPNTKIEFIGPPPTSGTRDSFVELVLEHSCKEIDWLKAVEKEDKDQFKKNCHSIREDGAFIEAGENDNLIVQKLAANKNAIGIFGYSFLEENLDQVQAVEVEGHTPSMETIASGDYPISRPLFIYAKKSHVNSVPGMKEFMAEYTSEAAWGDEGYLADKGLIPMPKEERDQVSADVKALKNMDL